MRIQAMVRACLAGQPIVIKGDPEHRISFVHLDDVLEANQRALERRPQEANYHISSAGPIALFELAERTQALSGCRVPIRVDREDEIRFEPAVVGLDSASSCTDLNFQPRWTIDQMIHETMDYVRTRSAKA